MPIYVALQFPSRILPPTDFPPIVVWIETSQVSLIDLIDLKENIYISDLIWRKIFSHHGPPSTCLEVVYQTHSKILMVNRSPLYRKNQAI
jgi:hypothetical protein